MRASAQNATTAGESGKSFLRTKRFWLFLFIFLTGLLISFPFISLAAMPGNFFYSLKRSSESFDNFIVLYPDLSATVQAYFSQRRIDEAITLATKLTNKNAAQQAQDAKTIRSLLEEYIAVADKQLPIFNNQIEKSQLPPQWASDFFQKQALSNSIKLEKLRLIAPPDAQGEILHAEAVTQESLALLADAQNLPPVSVGDVKEFTTFVTTGFISQSEMESILSAKSNRELYHNVDQKVQEGVLPATALSALDYDQVEKYFPQEYQAFRSNVEFNELRKIILLTLIIEPTVEQRVRIQQYLQNYTIGKLLPTNDIRPYVAPLIYGIGLSTETDTILKHINPNNLTPSRREIYLVWQHVNKQGLTTKEAFTQLFELSNSEISHDSDLLERIELEGLNALAENVVHLAFPPGWTKDIVLQIRDQFAVRIALLKKTEEQNGLNKKLNVNLTQALSYLSTPFTDTSLEAARVSFLASVFSFEQNLIVTANSTRYNKQVADQNIDSLQKKFLTTLTTLKTSANSKELADLEKRATQTITTLHAANIDFNTQLIQQQNYYASLQTSMQESKNMQNQYIQQLNNLLTKSSTAPSFAQRASYNSVVNLMAKNTSLLQDSLTAFISSHAEMQKQLTLSKINSYQQEHLFQQETTKLSSKNTDIKTQMAHVIGNMQLATDTAQKDLGNIALTLDTRFNLFLQHLMETQTLNLQKLTLSPLTQQSLGDTLTSSISEQEDIASTISAQIQDLKAFQSSLTQLGQNNTVQPSQTTIVLNPVSLMALATTFTQSQQTSQKQIDVLNNEWSSLPTGFSFTISDFDKTKKALDDYFVNLAEQLDAQYRLYREQLNAEIQRLRDATSLEIIHLQQKAKDLQKDLENKTPIQVDTLQPTSSPTGNPTTPPTSPPTIAPTATPTPPGNSGNAPGHNK